ncbi:MAG TPA: hypothetical protein VJC16_04470 [Candidatus Nanoarchaeia archaeon]|nr:hypothetical protein [Candidatus Nanoarchaeia archaeon]
MKPLVLFDVGAVLLKLDYGGLYTEAAAYASVSPDEFKWGFSRAEMDALTGRISTAQFLGRVRELGLQGLPQDVLEEIIGYAWPEEVPGMVELKRDVHLAGYPVGILSNMAEFAYDTINRKFPDVCEKYHPLYPAVYSFQIGSVKPEPPMYREVERVRNTYGLGQVILIEDKASYLRTGIQQFGWKGIWYTEHIDPAEAIKAVQESADAALPPEHFRRADSVDEVIAALREFGVHGQR